MEENVKNKKCWGSIPISSSLSKSIKLLWLNEKIINSVSATRCTLNSLKFVLMFLVLTKSTCKFDSFLPQVVCVVFVRNHDAQANDTLQMILAIALSPLFSSFRNYMLRVQMLFTVCKQLNSKAHWNSCSLGNGLCAWGECESFAPCAALFTLMAILSLAILLLSSEFPLFAQICLQFVKLLGYI